MAAPESSARRSGGPLGWILSSTIGLLVACVAVMWAIEAIDSILLDDRLQRNGIHPRRIDGLDGILWTPFLHSTFGHVASNSVPFIALGWLVALRGIRHWLTVTALSAGLGGGLVWLLAGGSNHIGASGIVFGYLGALLAAAWLDRRPAVLAPALVALFLYGSLLAGLVPQDDISWEGHLFGLLAGIVAARLSIGPRRGPIRSGGDDTVAYPWEIDEPWMDQP